MDEFEINKTINQMYGIPDKILTTCLQNCQIPCTVLYGLESVFLNDTYKAMKSKLTSFLVKATSICTLFFLCLKS